MALPRTIRRRVAGAADGEVCGQTFDGDVAAGPDDTYRHQTGWRDDATQTNVGEASGLLHTSMWWDNVTVPAGATIEAAYLSLDLRAGSWDGAGTLTKIYMNDVDDAAAPTSAAEFDALGLTSGVDWDDMNPGSNGYVNTPDITTPVQEVVDRGGWVSGQAMQAVHRDDGSSGKYVKYFTRDEGAGDTPKIHIQFCA